MHRCAACLNLEGDGRRRVPHDGLRLVNNQPVERMLESGLRAHTQRFVCRHCNTHWTLCDVEQSLFVHWVAHASAVVEAPDCASLPGRIVRFAA